MNYLEYRRNLKLKSSSEKLKDRVSKDLSKKKPLPKESARRKEENKEYNKVKKELKKKIQRCQIMSPDHDPNAKLEVHHLKGREGGLLTNSKHLMLVCRPCHRYVHDHPGWSKEHGFKLSKFTKG